MGREYISMVRRSTENQNVTILLLAYFFPQMHTLPTGARVLIEAVHQPGVGEHGAAGPVQRGHPARGQCLWQSRHGEARASGK